VTRRTVWVVSDRFRFEAEVWLWDGNAAWHFVSLPDDIADFIEHAFGHRARGFKSLRVEVRIGADTWRTSIFPDTKRGTYLLPIKKEIRRRNGLVPGSRTTVDLAMID
jgi:hypothetical protein